MTLQSDPAIVSLWICIIVTQGYVLGLLLGRGTCRQYPAFTAFIAFCVVRSLVLFYVAHNASSLYAFIHSGAYLLQLPLLVTLLLEVFRCLFSPSSTLPHGTLMLFVKVSCACTGAIVVLTLMFPGQPTEPWVTCVWALDQATSWVMFTIFGLIALLAAYFGIPWRHRLYGIALGFFVYLGADCAVSTIAAQSWIRSWPVGMAAFLTACIIWAHYFAAAEVSRESLSLEQLLRVRAVLDRFKCSLSEAPYMARDLSRMRHGLRESPWASGLRRGN